jgi:hypothetical protein
MFSRVPILSVLLIAVAVPGCFSFLHPWATGRAVDGTYDQVFQATLETLEARDFPIKEVDREAGKIVTGKRPVSGVGGNRPVETVRAYVEREEDAVSVRLFLTFLDSGGASRGVSGTRSGRRTQDAGGGALNKSIIYDDYLDAVEERVVAYDSSVDVRAGRDSLRH